MAGSGYQCSLEHSDRTIMKALATFAANYGVLWPSFTLKQAKRLDNRLIVLVFS